MKKSFLLFLFTITASLMGFAQTIVKGSVLDGTTGEPIPGVTVTIEGTEMTATTSASGEFSFTLNVPLGEQVLKVEKVGYATKRYPIVVNEGETLDISGMTLDFDPTDKKDLYTISISDDNLNSEDDGLTDNVSGLLQASRDVFLSAAAFDFSAAFFRPRGLDNANGKVLINGIEMNKQLTGRPQWGNWGGLNDLQRNQVFTMGMAANDYTFGDIAGTNNIIMRASKYRQGGRISYAAASRTYQGRIMGSYSSGLLKDGWAYSVLLSRRFGNQGYIEGTLYDANSFFASVEKKINDKHSINFTSVYAQNRRGRATSVTQEVFDLKGRQYNPFWGELDGEIRNSRVREIDEPIIMLNHFWDISSKVRLNTNVAYQFGEIANTRIDNGGTRVFTDPNGADRFFGGGINPNPNFWRNLPSFFLQNPDPTSFDFERAFLAREEFVNNGQVDWHRFYEDNATVRAQGGNAIYAVLADVVEDKQLTINSILDADLADNIRLNASVNYRRLNSQNYARLEDLLGGTGYLDVDFFADENDNAIEEEVTTNLAQSDLRNPNRIVGEGDRYKYNYDIDAEVASAFAQLQFKYNKVDFYLGGNVSSTTYQRNGLYENGFFPGGGNEGSFGKGEKLDFTNYGIKGGFTYKITGKHLVDVNASMFNRAPNIRNSYSNARQTNAPVIGLESEDIQSFDLSYIYRSPTIRARLTAFYSGFQNGTDIGFYFTQDLSGIGADNPTAFVQEVTTNIERRNIGAELGIEAQITPTIKLKGAASIGQFTFQNNPNLYLTSVDFDGPLTFGDGTTNLKDYHVSNGPERAYQIGFEYRDPDFWNIGITSNFFSNAYIDVSNLARSANFSTDFDGNTFSDYDPDEARDILRQEQFDDYMLVNIVGGKSWRLGDYFVGFFATINNVFDQEYRTGGFEQSRFTSFRELREDQSRQYGPLFGPRYFFGNGTTYYLNAYVRF